MNAFLRNKNFDFLILFLMDIALGFSLGLEAVILFSLGFVWNWVGSQDLAQFFEHKRYRFSTLKTVYNLQHIVQKPLPNAPKSVKLILRSLPAGIFWNAVILFFESSLPGWIIFAGSFALELLQLRPKHQEQLP
jgi:hypothetical protein